MELTSKEKAVIYNALCDRRKKLEKIVNDKPTRVRIVMVGVYEDIENQIVTIDELFESGKF